MANSKKLPDDLIGKFFIPKQLFAISGWCGGQFSNPLFSIFLIPIIILHGSAGDTHAPTVKVQNNVR